MSFPRYESYKDSGVEWVGEVPEHWDVVRLRFITECLDGKRIPLNSEQRADKQGSIPYWGANSIVDYVDEALFDEVLVLLGEDGAPFFDRSKPVAFLSVGEVWPNNHVHVLRPSSPEAGKFIIYSLNITDYATFIDGSTRDKLTQSKMNNIPIPWPADDEKSIIVTFLDREAAKIDALIAEQKNLIELLKEKRQAVISHAVTKGLNPTAPMKDSGIEWLGKVPEHWEVRPIKYVIGKIDSGTSVNAADEPTQTHEIGVLKTSCVYSGIFDPSENKTVVEQEINRVSCPLKVDTLIVSRMNTPDLVGATGLVTVAPENIYLPDRLWQISFWDTCTAFIYFWTQTPVYRAYIKSVCAGTSSSMQNLSQDQFRSFILVLPTLDEQVQIAAFLDQETSKLDTLTSEAKTVIALLQERRTALISAAVTGKIDVRGLVSAKPEVEQAA